MDQLPDIIEMPVLLKISKVKYLKEIQDGNLYMNNLKYFVNLEKETQQQGIGDIREASLTNVTRHELFIQVDGEERKKIPIGPAPGIVYDMEALYHPVFCLMGKILLLKKEKSSQYIGEMVISKEELEDFVDNQNKYGVLIIFNVYEFLERFYNAVKNVNIAGKHGFVNYRDMRIPNIVNGKWILDDTFTKDIRFEKQSEFRIELFEHCEKAMLLNIGSINDISYITDCDTLISGFDIIQTVEEVLE